MKKVNVSSYLQASGGSERNDEAANGRPTTPPKYDATYSSLLGYGFRPSPRPRPKPTPAASVRKSPAR